MYWGMIMNAYKNFSFFTMQTCFAISFTYLTKLGHDKHHVVFTIVTLTPLISLAMFVDSVRDLADTSICILNGLIC